MESRSTTSGPAEAICCIDSRVVCAIERGNITGLGLARARLPPDRGEHPVQGAEPFQPTLKTRRRVARGNVLDRHQRLDTNSPLVSAAREVAEPRRSQGPSSFAARVDPQPRLQDIREELGT